MAITKTRNAKWDEASRLKLVAAVIKVEEAMKASNGARSKGNGTRSTKGIMSEPNEKWKWIADLLPPELGAPIARTKTSSKYRKCQRTFYNVMFAYRAQLRGKAGDRRLTTPVFEIMNRREELLNARCSVSDETLWRFAGSSQEVEASIGSRSDEQQLSTLSTPSKGQSRFSARREESSAGSFDHTFGETRHFNRNRGREESPRFPPNKCIERGSAVRFPQSNAARVSIPTPQNGIQQPARSRRQMRGPTRAEIPETQSVTRRQSTKLGASLSEK